MACFIIMELSESNLNIYVTSLPTPLGLDSGDEICIYKKLHSLYLSHLKEFGKILTLQVKELRVMSINIPWLEVLKACYPNAGIAEETEIIVVSPQYTADIAVIMSTTDRYKYCELCQLYMSLQLIYSEAA